jgi:hypothetical protein
MPGRFFESGMLFAVARIASQSVKADPTEGGQLPALTSIVFSVMSLEAFLNEVAELARDLAGEPSEPQSVPAFAQLMDDIERSRASLVTKFVLCNWVLTGRSVDKPCIPHFMASRIYIDLSSDGVFEENYQKLVRNLYGKPLLRRPPLGTAPAYITEEEDQMALRTSRKVGAIKDALINERRSASGLISDFLQTVLSSLEDFRLTGGAVRGFDDKVASSIERMLPLRDDFVDFSLALFSYRDSVDLDQIHGFWEKLIAFTFRPEDVQSWAEVDYDNFKFFNYELMLYFISALLSLKKYREAGFFIRSRYFYLNSTNDLRQNGIEIFNRYARSLDEFRNNRLDLHRASVTADLLKSRATRKDITFGDIRETDLVLHYLTALRGERFEWFPRTSTYGGRRSGIDLFERMVSKRHFEKVSALFGVDTVEQLKTLVSEHVARNKDVNSGFSSDILNFNIRPVESLIDLQNVAAIP